MTWSISVTHTDKEGNQLGCQKIISDDMVDLAIVDLRIAVFKEVLAQIEAKLKEKNT